MGDNDSDTGASSPRGGGKGSFAFYEAEGHVCMKTEQWDKACEAFSRGLHAKAEALFAAGDFEYALMFYHRGNHLRASDDFRLGIQKAEQAISDSIAQEKLPVAPTAGKSGTAMSRGMSRQSMSQSMAQTVRSSLSKLSGNPGTPYTSLDMVKNAPAPDKRQAKKLLGEMFTDREYLENLAKDTALGGVTEIASSGLKYLDTRTEFWRQQNPPDPDAPKTQSRGLKSSHSRPPTTMSRFSMAPSRVSTAASERAQSSASVTQPSGAPSAGSQKQRAVSRQKYLEQTRYAIQTLENVNAAIDYGDPELGLKFAKGFLSRLATLEIPDKPRILGNLYSCMGITYMELGKLTLAAIHHRKDLDIAVKYNYKDAYLRALGNLGQVYQRIGDHSQAIAMYEKKLMFGDEGEASRLCESIGRCYLDAGDTDNAIRFADRAIKAAEIVADVAQQLGAHLLHGHALSVAGQQADAVHSFERCLDLARASNDVMAQANALTHLGNAYMQMGEVQRSIEFQQQALELSAQLNQQPTIDVSGRDEPIAA